MILIFSAACSSPASEKSAASQPAEPSSPPAQVAPTELALSMPTVTATPQPTSTPTRVPPTPVPLDTLTPTPITPTVPSCTNQAEFVKHLTVGPNTSLQQEQAFAKMWRVKNTGTCTWSTDYALVFVVGESMEMANGALSIPLYNEVPPDQTIDLRVDMIAPMEPGLHTGYWTLKPPSGATFGFGGTPNQLLETAIWVIDPNAPKPYNVCG